MKMQILISTLVLFFLLSAWAELRAQTQEYVKDKAYNILNTKCNTCHRRQNPFMVFSRRNMDRRAGKIYQQVFIEKKMPKGDEVELSTEEAETLLIWISSLKTS